MSQQKLSRKKVKRLCSGKNKSLDALKMRVLLMRGYRTMGNINSEMAEFATVADNCELSEYEQKLTECEQK